MLESIDSFMKIRGSAALGKLTWQHAGLVALFAFAVLSRLDLSFVSDDMRYYGYPWYDSLISQGASRALGTNFSNYTPPYTYLLALMTLTSGFLPKLTAIKLISVAADAVNAWLVYRIVRLKYPGGLLPFWAAGAFLCLPTVFLNSAVWGQADAIYTGFLLATLYLLLRERPLPAMLAYAGAFAFKAQAIFMAPFLVVMFCARRIRLWHFLLIPAVYALACLPAVLLGRGWIDVLTIYWQQGASEDLLARGAANPYIFLAYRYYKEVLLIGILIACVVILTWLVLTVSRTRAWSRERLLLSALASLALVPYLLPKMHDRYFYPAEITALLAAFFIPGTWIIAAALSLSGLLGYGIYLFKWNINLYALGAAINTWALVVLLIRQFRALPDEGDSTRASIERPAEIT